MSQGQSGNQASSGASSDAEFVRKAASGGMMEVELGKLAQQKGSSARVKQIGKTLERDHSKANNELKKVASSQGLTVPDQMEAEHRSHVDQLSNLSGQEFDQQFLQMQAEHHRKDISEFQQEASQGQSSRVKNFANKQLPVLQRHLSMIESNQGSAAREGTSGTDSNKGMSGRSGSDSTTGHGTSDHGTSTSGQGTSTGGQRDQTKDR